MMTSFYPPALPQGKGAKAFGLNLAGTDDALTDDGGGLARLHLRELREGHGLDFAVDVDAVGDFRVCFSFYTYIHVIHFYHQKVMCSRTYQSRFGIIGLG